MKQVQSVNELLEFLQNIDYGYMDMDKNVNHEIDSGFKKKYILSSPEDVLKNEVGTCYDIVELERVYFKNLGLKFQTYFMVYYESKKIFTHTFVVYEENEKFYWFEYAWAKNRGIHEYMSLYDLLTDVRDHFKKFNNLKFMDLDYLCVYKYKKPKFHIGLKDFYKHCENGENVLI